MAPRTLIRFAFAGLSLVACQREEDSARRAPAKPPPVLERSSAEPAASAEPAPKPQKIPRPAGAIPFEFPTRASSAKKGDFVLAPSRSWIDEAFEKGGEGQTFIYYGAWMQEPGPAESLIRTLPGQNARVPNSMILVVGSGQSAKPGDIVLTAWASGSGLQRAIVVEGGAPEKPRVRYLDIDYGNPSGWGQKDDELPGNTFRVLTRPGELGTTLACKDGPRHTRWVVVAEAGGKLLGLGFAGKMRVLLRGDCVGLPLSPKLRVGDKVFVPLAGAFTEAKVTKLDAKIGRVTAKVELGSGVKEEVFSFTNVADKL